MKKLILGCSTILLICGCSSDVSGPAVAGNNVNEGFTAVSSSLQSVDALMANDPSVVPASISPFVAGGISLVWGGANFMPDPRCSGGGSDPHCGLQVTMKNYTSFILDKDAKRDNGSDISVFGRIKTQLAASCLMTSALGTLPSAGTQTITFSPSVIATAVACGFPAEGMASFAGQTISATVSIPIDVTYYDRKYVLNFGGDINQMYVRVTSTDVNVLAAESGSRTAIALNRTNGVIRAEYVSRGSDGGGEFHRIHYDATTNLANIVGASFDHNTPVNKFFFTMVGRPNVANSHVAFSVAVNGFGVTTVDSGAVVGLNHYRGCINQTTRAMAIADTLICTGITGFDSAGPIATVFTNMDSATLSATLPFTGVNGFGETRTVPFTTGASVFTSAVLIGP